MKAVLRVIALLAVGLVAAAGIWTGTTARADGPTYDPVRSWNEQALATVRTKSASDAQAARLYAMVNVAVYDAVNGILTKDKHEGARDHALVPASPAPRHGDLLAAASAAAHAVLAGEYPDLAALRYDPLLASELASLEPNKRSRQGAEWGAWVGSQVRAARANDGSAPNETQPAGAGPGQFRTAWSGVQFRNLAPFGITDSAVYVGDGPPSLDSLDYAGAYANVKIIGNAGFPDPAKLDTFRYWSLGGGTSQPPGAWIQVGLAVTQANQLALPDKARLFALVSMAMADTVGPTYMTKFVYRHWRPSTAIREGALDGNDLTDGDATWNHRSGGSIGSSPEYWSGHSSFSASAATVLAGFYGTDRISFTLVTDSAPKDPVTQEPIPRSYSSFSEAAAEAGRSREFGGIHFSFSNDEGLAAGRAIAAEILGRKLLPIAE
jgi:hypothetical protein